MAVNYNRRKSNISNRNWSDYSEKENAKYMSKQLKDFGYKVPSYMKKGQINQKQLEIYVNRVLNNIDKMIDKDYKNSLSFGEKRRYNKLNKIIVDRGGEKNNRKLINNAIEIAKNLSEYSKNMNRTLNNNSALESVNRWIDKGYANVETLLSNIHSSRLSTKNGNLSSMLETINNLRSVEHVEDYLDRIGASDKYRKSFINKFNKLNVGQKIFFNTSVWAEFKVQYSKEDYYEATTVLARKGYLEETLKRASDTILGVM